MDFGEVLTKAWKIIWKYKVLWIFGIFASCSGGGGGGNGGSGAQYSGNSQSEAFQTFNSIEPWVIALIIGAAILIGLIIMIVVIVVSTIGRIGLVQGTHKADQDDDAEITFMGLINSMKPFFWRVLGLNLLVGLAVFFIVMAFVIAAIFGTLLTFGIGLFCLIPIICLLVPVFWVLSTFIEMANVAIVVEDLGITEALQRGWEIFKDNLANLIVLGLILVIGGMIVGVVIALPLILTIVPLMIGIIAAAYGDTSALATSGVVISGLCCIAYLPVLIVISGILKAYISAAWTLTYLRLSQGPAEPAVLPDTPDLESLPDEAGVVAAAAESLSDAEESSPPEVENKTGDEIPDEDF